ncbi:MAG TPA: outer membrane protein assembly factor BamA [Kiritimatiellia bacterium]|nr:outer membrane protein assembly factor BamA [Kiritimatiellia bacterium]
MRGRRSHVLLLAVLLLSLSASVLAVEVKEIRVEGHGHGIADRESVLAFTSTREGDEFSRSAIGRDVRSLQKSGRFSSVRVTVDTVTGGVQVTFIVESKPRIRRLEISGATEIGNKKVRELLELGVGDPVDDTTLAVRSQKVKDHYRKEYYPYTKMSWTLEPAAEPGMVNLKVNVVEGKRSSVKKIRFVGNKHVSKRVLKKAMKQRQTNWLSWITGAGTYSPGDLEADIETLRRIFMDKGFLDAKVNEPQLTTTRRGNIRITMPVEEGRVYKIGQVRISGVTMFPQDDVYAAVRIKPGDVASLADIEQSGQNVRDFYGSRGHIRTVVDQNVDTDPVKGTADIRYNLTEGGLAYIRNIRIRGNSQTKDKVIRRELAVYPGEIFNEVKVRTSERRLRNLGYFSYVNSIPESTSVPNQYDLVFEVEEQRTGQFMVGAGFSSVENLIGFVELSQGNFDITDWPRFSGGGQKMKVRAQFGTQSSSYELSFVEPWFLNRRLSLGFDLYQRDSRFLSDDYDQKNLGASVSLGKPVGPHDRAVLTYGLEQIDVYNVADSASDQIKEEEGNRTKSYMTLEVIHDTRDSVFIATRGNRSSVSATVAGGPLGAETDLYNLQARTSQFFPLWFDHVFNVRGWASVVEEYGSSDRVPIFDRLFLGGPRNVRGFKFRDVGPKDEDGEPIGGKSAAYMTAEYTIPVAEKVRLAGFYDAGLVDADAYTLDFKDLNTSVGFGVRFDFPGFPIQLDYAWPLEADPYNDKPSGRFSFWLGYVY